MKGKRYIKTLVALMMCAAMIMTFSMLSGCKGKDGNAGANGADATQPVYGAPSASENLQASISSVSMASGNPVVTFTLLDEKGAPIDPRSIISAGGRCRFYIAQIDSAGYYKNYFMTSSGLPTYDSASSPSASSAATSTAFATTATPGIYTFTFSKNITTEAMYDATRTHSVVAQISRSITSSKGAAFSQAANPYINFRPDGNAVTVTREVVAISGCNECHGTLGVHGGTRRDIPLCIVCHYPGVTDPESGQTVDMKSMIHKIHMGSKLPSNIKGADYELAGTSFKAIVHSYRTADSFSRNTPFKCVKCHKLGTDAKGNAYGKDAAMWKKPTRENCNTCHDLTTYDGSTTITVKTGANLTTSLTATPHMGGVQPDDALCAVCHSDADDKDYQSNSVPGAHLNPADSNLNTGLTFSIVSVSAVSGSTVTVRFVPRDSTGAAYTLMGGTSAGADAVTIALAYMTGKDYDNSSAEWRAKLADGTTAETYIRGKTKTVSSTSVNPATFYDSASSSYIVSMGVVTVPAGTGVGTVAIYGSKLIIVPTLADKNTHRTASQHITAAYATTGFWHFNLATGAQVTDASSIRRVVVSYSKCNACHTAMAVHSRADTQLCAMCHAPNLYAKATATYPDGSGNLKDMIHGIHGAPTTTVFFGMNPVTAEMPNDPRNCTICHVSAETAGLPLPTGVANSMMTGSTNTALDSAATASLPARAACMSCHTSSAAAAHAVLNTSGTTESCDVCHGSGSLLGNAHAPVR